MYATDTNNEQETQEQTTPEITSWWTDVSKRTKPTKYNSQTLKSNSSLLKYKSYYPIKETTTETPNLRTENTKLKATESSAEKYITSTLGNLKLQFLLLSLIISNHRSKLSLGHNKQLIHDQIGL